MPAYDSPQLQAVLHSPCDLSVIMLASPSVLTLTTDYVVQDSDIIVCSTLTELFSAMVCGDVLFEQLACAKSVGIAEPLALDI